MTVKPVGTEHYFTRRQLLCPECSNNARNISVLCYTFIASCSDTEIHLLSYLQHYSLKNHGKRIELKKDFVRFEVFPAVTMKNVIFWDIRTQFVLHRRHIMSPLQSPVSQCYVRSEVFRAETMKNGILWEVTPCGSCKNRRFGGT
jgi:hypothetical protein